MISKEKEIDKSFPELTFSKKNDDEIVPWNQVVQEYLSISIPSVLSRFAVTPQFFMVFAVTQFNDPQKTAGLGLALSIFNVAFNSTAGILAPCEILTANAYGQKDLKLCGTYLNRGILILNIALVVLLGGLITFTEPILLFFGQNREVVNYCMQFQMWALPGFYFEMMFHLYRRWLQ